MHQIPATNPILKDLFDPQLPNSPALWAVLKGNHSGKALVDELQLPSQAVLRTDAVLTYFSTRTRQSFLNQVIAVMREFEEIRLVWPHETSLYPPEIESASIEERFEFSETDSDTLSRLRSQLPTGCLIRAIDAQLLQRCEWHDDMVFYTGSTENFLAHGIGLCLMQGDEILVEVYASALGKTRAEIGAITRENYRGRSYAQIACAYLIEACQQRGYQAYWSCDADNTASMRVAQKLGFQKTNSYQIFKYEPIGSQHENQHNN
jgi:RimJ/RimL family protein N-acetyltransferase